MLIARWQIDARFGHKQNVIDAVLKWTQDIALQVGLLSGRMLTGAIGALEATVEHDWEVESLVELERARVKLGGIEAHKQWSKDLEPYVVSGTSRWTIRRVL
ncbi:hypothetical protein BPNPMPFG_008418 (plasmid) [Mesorhizobium sp. AR07]|uniref:hypothetical protein n=1 Tax=Mesorhizobium sp. AR07 TaxID=2865838 RepID=UPI00215F45CD|nr:hypothetical protein [Mesorhizobium sp. AR07]UVK49443.1 hypothetical protein BPNPMPFG_008418 [Mesorhizobium sp. AR07]